MTLSRFVLVCSYIYWSVHTSVCLFIHLFVCSYIYLFVHTSICLFIHLFDYFIHLFIYSCIYKVKKYHTLLDNVIIHKEGDIETVPELYFVPWEFVSILNGCGYCNHRPLQVNAEYHNPHSQVGWIIQKPFLYQL